MNRAPFLYEILTQTARGYTRTQIEGDYPPGGHPGGDVACGLSARNRVIEFLVNFGVARHRAEGLVDRVIRSAMNEGFDTAAVAVADGFENGDHRNNGYTVVVIAPDA